MKKLYLLVILLSFTFFYIGCTVMQQMTNISRLKYKLDSVSNFQLSGINLENKKSISDFSVIDGAKLLSAYSKGSLPVSFNLNVLENNPNDGGGYPAQDLDIVDFKWRLLIDNVETIAGNIASPIRVPGKGESTKFALSINLDLLQYFNNKGYDGLINLALKLGGQDSRPANIKLRVQPTIRTFLGDMKYPNELEIVDTEFR